MRISIRTFLFVNLLVLITVTLGIIFTTNLYFQHQYDRKLARNQLKQTATLIHNIALLDNQDQRINAINLIAAAQTQPIFFKVIDQKTQHIILEHTQELKKDINHHQNTEKDLTHKDWIQHILIDSDHKLKILVKQAMPTHTWLKTDFAKQSGLTILVIYLLLLLLILLIICFSFRSINVIINEVKNRRSGFLVPLNLDHTPQEIKPLINELNELFDRLSKAAEQERRFASDAAHELRTPLAALYTHMQIILKSDSTQEREEGMKKVLSGIKRSTHVVQQLLDMSRMTPNTMIKLENVNLHTETQYILADIAPMAIQKNISLELTTHDKESKGAIVPGNATSIGILVRNLIDNAIRYTPNKGKVTAKIKRTDQQTILIIEDNGPGIDADKRTRVFDRFYRVNNHETHGCGLGLGIVKQIVQLHRANIQLDQAKSGTGLRVTVGFLNRIDQI